MLIRMGVMLLFFFVVLGAAQDFSLKWQTSLAGICPGGLCTNPIPYETLTSLFASMIVLAFIAIGVPITAAHIVGFRCNNGPRASGSSEIFDQWQRSLVE